MKNLSRFALLSKTLISALFLSLLFALPAHARVGQVLFSLGDVTIEKPGISVLKRGDKIEAGDVIVTGSKGIVQIRLDDKTKIRLRSNTRFVVEALSAPATASTPSIGSGAALSARFNLQKGGFRTITGLIAQRDRSVYQLTTPSAVIRVRGTNYVARICAADCGTSNDGLYVGVSNGAIAMNNAGGDLNLGTNQFGFAANFNSAPMRLLAPPSGLQDDGLTLLEEEEEESDDEESEESSDEESSEEESSDEEPSEEGSDESSDESSEESTEETSDENTDAMAAERSDEVSTEASATASTTSTSDTTTIVEDVPQALSDASGGDLTDGQSSPRALSFTLGQLASGINANISEITTDDLGSLTGFTDPGSSSDVASGLAYDIGTAINKNVGFDPSSGLRWGRWADGIATQTTSDGAASNVDLSNQGLHWVTSAEGDVPVQVITGTQSYQLVGNTDPTDNLGNVGVLGSATFNADFTNSTVTSSLALSINQATWNAVGTGSISTGLFSGLYDTVTINGDLGGTGSFGGIFGGFENGLPLGAGLNYQLNNGTTTVSGSAVFNSTGR